MVMRLSPGVLAGPPGAQAVSGPPPFNIVIRAADGAELVTITEKDGKLSVGGDRSRWEEGAVIFLDQMMQWSGAMGIRWREEVAAAVEGQ